MTKNRKKIESIYTYWHDQADRFSQLYSSWNPLLLANRLFLQQRQDVIIGISDFNKDFQVLDLGCGSGELIHTIVSEYREVIGIDYSLMMLKSAKQQLSAHSVTVIQADCNAIPLQDEAVEQIFALGLLDYVQDVDSVLKEFHRVMKYEGNAIFTIPKSPSLFAPLRWSVKMREKLFQIPPILNLYTKKKLIEHIERLGFEMNHLSSLWTTMWIAKVRKLSQTTESTSGTTEKK
jgi:ubiquinone/menaquinone biosynthesis C-methylase UbiE